MKNQRAFTIASLALTALGLVGCGSDTAQQTTAPKSGSTQSQPQTQKAKQTPASIKRFDKADVTLTCYDYGGNAVLTEHLKEGNWTDGISMSSDTGTVSVSLPDGKTAYIQGGAGCIEEKLYFDAKNPVNAEALKNVESKAPYYGIVSNGSDKILLAGKFNDASPSAPYFQMTLKDANGDTLRQIYATPGLLSTFTPNAGGIDKDLLKAAFALPESAPAATGSVQTPVVAP